VLINAIFDFGRGVCVTPPHAPHLLAAFRTVVKWDMERLMRDILWKDEKHLQEAFAPSLIASAKEAIRMLQPDRNKSVSFVTFAGSFGSHGTFSESHLNNRSGTLDLLRYALWHAHTTLLAKDRTKYAAEKDEGREATMYQRVGLYFASSRCRLAITEVPALINYRIDDYDGQETVCWREPRAGLI